MKAQGNGNDFENSMSNAICYLCLEKSYPLQLIRDLDVASFMVLLDFVEEQSKEMEKAKRKAKKAGKHG